MHSSGRIAALLAFAGAIAVPIAGCGSSNNNSTSSAATQASQASTSGGSATSGPGGTVDLTATDYKLTPSDKTVQSGKVTFNEKNMSQRMHSLEIEDVTPGHDQELEGGVAAGQNGTLTVHLKPGHYEFYCPIDHHREMGMQGEITVK